VRRTGVRRLVAVAFVFYAARYLLFSLIHVAWPVWPIMLLQGFSFSFFTGGMVMLAGSLVPPGLKAVGQTVFMAVGFSLAAVAGNVASGAVVDHLGVFVMYRLAAICSLAAGTLFAGGLWLGRRAASSARLPAQAG
jgi:MFS family permease